MSIKIMNEAWEIKGLEPTAKLILMCLADHSNEDDRTCWPAISTIARKCDVSRSTVKRHMKCLAQKGVISKRSRTGDSTLYYILPDGVVQIEPGSTLDRGVVHSCEPGGGSLVNPKPSVTINEPSLSICAVSAKRAPDAFEKFWSAFPEGRKRGKGKCRDLFNRIIKTKSVPSDQLVQAVMDMRGIDPDYPPMPATWLNQGRWEDTPQASQRSTKPTAHQNTMNNIRSIMEDDERARRETENHTHAAGLLADSRGIQG